MTEGQWEHSLVNEASRSMADDQWCLATLEPRVDRVTLLHSLVSATRCLAIAGRGTAAFPNALVVGALVVRNAREDRSTPSLHRQGGKQGNQGFWLRSTLDCHGATTRRLRKW